MSNNVSGIFAGIVTYYPDFTKLGRLIDALENQVDMVIVFNNGGCLDSQLKDLFHATNHKILGCADNVGIAKALNEICHLALDAGADYVVTFDQDSAPGRDFVCELYGSMGSASEVECIAAVGPLFFDVRGNKEVLPVFQSTSWWIKKINPLEVWPGNISASLLITSGMLLKLSAWKIIGEFREDFFIDHVDTEWCFRAINSGFQLFVCPSVLMEHELSDESPIRVFGRLVLKYSPFRRYYYFRNTTFLLFEKHTPQGMRIYLIATIFYRFFVNFLVDKNKFSSIKAMLMGVAHGIAGRMGKL